MAWTVVIVAALAYIALLVLLRLNEPRLIYFPGAGRTLLAPSPALRLPVRRVQFSTDDGLTLVSWLIPPGRDSTGFWFLICHGNAGNLSEFDRPLHYAGLHQLGVGILAFDYRGYGESQGAPSEKGLYRDAQAAYRYLRDEVRVPADRIVLFGHSLGSTVAVDLATRVSVAGLILEGAPTSVRERGAELYPYIPVRWIAGSRFDSYGKISQVKVPKLFLHAEADEVIPIAHGRRLYEAAPPPKTFVQLHGTHSDAFEVDSARYFDSIGKFLASLPTPRH
jgi:hypothetical protein